MTELDMIVDDILQQMLNYFDDRESMSMKKAMQFKARFAEDLKSVHRMGAAEEFKRSGETLESLLYRVKQLADIGVQAR